jgi:hypothetical protein
MPDLASRVLPALAALLGMVAVPAALWSTVTERHVATAARTVRGLARPGDLVLVSASWAGRQPDPAGLMRPFGALATAVVDPARPGPDLVTFPQERFFLVGEDLDGARMGLASWESLPGTVRVGAPARVGVPLLRLAERLAVSVERDGVARPCAGPHASGGVRCGGAPWQYVGPVVLEARGREVACLWAHPVRDHVLRVDVPSPGSAARARLWLQYADEAIHDADRPPLSVEVEALGQRVLTTSCRNRAGTEGAPDGVPGMPGHCPLEVDVASGDLPDAATPWLRLRIWTTDAARQIACLGGTVEARP